MCKITRQPPSFEQSMYTLKTEGQEGKTGPAYVWVPVGREEGEWRGWMRVNMGDVFYTHEWK
jgi:hypothetical protein